MVDESEKLKRGSYYRLGDYLNLEECRRFGTTPERGRLLVRLGSSPRSIKAKWNGEFREPKKGEWYLSGSSIEAYRAPNDFTTKFHIAVLVMVKTVSYDVEVENEHDH